MNITKRELDMMQAYSIGYWQAREHGTESNPYEPETNPLAHACYRLGYEHGISDYRYWLEQEETDTLS